MEYENRDVIVAHATVFFCLASDDWMQAAVFDAMLRLQVTGG
jgi:hypothetical protein